MAFAGLVQEPITPIFNNLTFNIMSYLRNPDFIKGMNLSKVEIETFERYVDLIEKAQKNSVEFFNDKERLAFTPAALLVVAVAKFAYDVYQDYGVVARTPAEFQVHFKKVIQELCEIEAMSEEGAPNLDTYAKLRKDLLDAK